MNSNYPAGITDAIVSGTDFHCPECGHGNPDLDGWFIENYGGECCGIERITLLPYPALLPDEDEPTCNECHEFCEYVYVYVHSGELIGCENCLEVMTFEGLAR